MCEQATRRSGYNGVNYPSMLQERGLPSVGTKDKEWPPKGASEREKKANVEFVERRFEKIERIDEKRRG